MIVLEYKMRQLGMNQTDLSRASGVNRVVINRLLHGELRPYPKWRKAIADAVGWTDDPQRLFDPLEVAND